MRDILIIYASNHGATARIASRISEVIQDDGARLEVREAGSAAQLRPSDYDAVVVGASIHAGHHQRSVVDWVKGHATALNGMPSAFFSVSLSAAEDTEEAREANRKYIDDFLDETGWTPRTTESFAGALQYREYDFMTRLLIRLMMKHQGHPTDTSRDYVYTDWDAVERFAHECIAMAGQEAGTPS